MRNSPAHFQGGIMSVTEINRSEFTKKLLRLLVESIEQPLLLGNSQGSVFAGEQSEQIQRALNASEFSILTPDTSDEIGFTIPLINKKVTLPLIPDPIFIARINMEYLEIADSKPCKLKLTIYGEQYFDLGRKLAQTFSQTFDLNVILTLETVTRTGDY